MSSNRSVRVLPSADDLFRAAAEEFVRAGQAAIEARGRFSVALSGGSTPRRLYALLTQRYVNFDWGHTFIFFGDERHVPPDHADSNYRMTRLALLDHVPLRSEQIHRIEGELEPEVAAARYESELRNSFRLEGAESPRFDLIALGMGSDGHTASIFPHTEAVHEMSRLVTANHVPQRETTRITLTWPVINHARSVFFFVAGEDKASVLREVLTGPSDPERLPSQLIWPSSGILTLILDRAAASLLPPTDADGCGVLERNR